MYDRWDEGSEGNIKNEVMPKTCKQ
jgi:hypothetical protein